MMVPEKDLVKNTKLKRKNNEPLKIPNFGLVVN